MVCKRYLDLKTTTVVGVSTYPLMDSNTGMRG